MNDKLKRKKYSRKMKTDIIISDDFYSELIKFHKSLDKENRKKLIDEIENAKKRIETLRDYKNEIDSLNKLLISSEKGNKEKISKLEKTINEYKNKKVEEKVEKENKKDLNIDFSSIEKNVWKFVHEKDNTWTIKLKDETEINAISILEAIKKMENR